MFTLKDVVINSTGSGFAASIPKIPRGNIFFLYNECIFRNGGVNQKLKVITGGKILCRRVM